MNDTTSGAMSRRKLLEAAGTAAAAVAAASLAGSAAAAAPTRMSFQAKWEGRLSNDQFFQIPVRPLVRAVREPAVTGEATLLGQFQWAGHFLARRNLDDTAGAYTDGIGAMTGANGDALFFTYSGSGRQTSPGLETSDFDFTITGGSGKFSGVIGSGTFHDAVDLIKGTVARTVDGTLLLPG